MPTHPPYKDMINTAIETMKERSGSSRQAILKFIMASYIITDEKKAGTQIRMALRRGVMAGYFEQVKGNGASGSFKLGRQQKRLKKAAEKNTSNPKMYVAKKLKKPASKKTPAKESQKKPATKKSPKKPATKKSAKKPATKKSPQKPETKKSTKEPAKKPAANKAA
ncbi:UNVERIFIED_CONTAM: hypothetical protein GTU68_005375 [Idotea baltica]|nr:hypothetical protein [Idotea baltica]